MTTVSTAVLRRELEETTDLLTQAEASLRIVNIELEEKLQEVNILRKRQAALLEDLCEVTGS